MARRRGTLNDEQDTDRWLVSYADFITLLFAFFVVMYSVSSVNLGKYRVLSDAMSTAFSSGAAMKIKPGDQLGVSVQRAPISLGIEGQYAQKSMADTAARIEKSMQDWIRKGQIAVRGNEKWLEVEINTSILFASGSAGLSAQASIILQGLSDIFKSSNNPLYVAGYTDNLPINTLQYPSNWELSSARAASVVRLFAEAGINPSRMGAIGFAEYRPSADNDSVDNRQKNRRVVIRMLAGEDMFADTTPFADNETSSTATREQTAQSLQPNMQINSLQPGEPARAFQ
ncbi:MAG: flagellar motor protein MotD [Gammaproteobacteria bacterium]|nr:MAG: flagellar motor protein MotD [Gammaproteobacteria bacterium]